MDDHQNPRSRQGGLSVGMGAGVLALVVMLALSVYGAGDAPAPGSSGTVSQATQNPGPAQTNR